MKIRFLSVSNLLQGGKQKMKKYLIPLFLVMMVLTSALALADDSIAIDEEVPEEDVYEVNERVDRVDFKTVRFGQKMIHNFMEEFGLDEDDSIGDLLHALDARKESHKDDAKAKFGVETDKELREAIHDHRVEKLRVDLGLDESLTDEEVFEVAREVRLDEVYDILGLDSEANEDEYEAALEQWKEDHKLVSRTVKHRAWPFRHLF
jgi:hypothetical protein